MSGKIKIPESRYDKVVKYFCIILQLGMILFIMWRWNSLPAKLPMHYNSAGEIDSYGSKWNVWIMPVVAVLTYVLLAFCERYPELWSVGVDVNYRNKEKVYRIVKNLLVSVKAAMILIFTYLGICVAIGKPLEMWFFPVSMLLTFGPILFFGIQLVRISKK